MVTLFFIEMNQPTSPCFPQFMPFLPELGVHFGISKTLAGKNKRNVPLLIKEDLACRKRVFMRHPPRVNSHLRNKMRSGIIKGLVFHGCCHGLDQMPAIIGWSLTDNSNYARHAVSTVWSFR